MRAAHVLLMIGVLLTVSSALTTYVSDFNTLHPNGASTTQEPFYRLGYQLAGHTVQINLTTQNSVEDFHIGGGHFFIEVDDYSDNQVACTIVSGCGTLEYTCVLNCNILISKEYRLYVWRDSSPSNNYSTPPNRAIYVLAHFQMQATSFITATGGPSNSSAAITEIFKAT